MSSTGDELEVDLAKGTVHNLTNGKTLAFVPYPDFILEIIEAGGLYKQLDGTSKIGCLFVRLRRAQSGGRIRLMEYIVMRLKRQDLRKGE